VYCRTGRRSTIACAKLDAQKFPAEKQYHLEGGITAWQKQGHAVEK
jgi:rhodanese-related sulfurtransferase